MLNKNIPKYVMEITSALRCRQMYIDLPAIDAPVTAIEPNVFKESIPPNMQKKNKNISPELENIVRLINNTPQCFLSQGDIFDRLEIKGGAKRDSLKKEALKKQLVIIHTLQVGRVRKNYWENTAKIRRLLNLPKPNIPGKGGYLHQLTGFYICKWAILNGYSCRLEAQIGPSNKAVDGLLIKGNEIIVIECCISEPIAKELVNIQKDIASGFNFTKLLFLVRDNITKKNLQKTIDGDLFASKFREKIEIGLIGDFIKDK